MPDGVLVAPAALLDDGLGVVHHEAAEDQQAGPQVQLEQGGALEEEAAASGATGGALEEEEEAAASGATGAAFTKRGNTRSSTSPSS